MHVAQQARFTRRVRQNRECSWIGHQADLADRTQPRPTSQTFGQGERLHGDGQANARFEAVGQRRGMGSLAADNVGVIAVQEPH